MTVAQTAQKKAGPAPVPNGKATRKARGTGPFQLTFADASGRADYKRVPKAVTGLVITAGGVAKTFDPAALPDATKSELIILGMAQRIKTYVTNHADDTGSNVHDLATSMYSDLLNGHLYTRTESSAPRGKKFDSNIYAEALRATYAFMSKKLLKNKAGRHVLPLTDAQVLDFKTLLESMTPKERTEKIKNLKLNAIYTRALVSLQTKDAAAEAFEELPF